MSGGARLPHEVRDGLPVSTRRGPPGKSAEKGEETCPSMLPLARGCQLCGSAKQRTVPHVNMLSICLRSPLVAALCMMNLMGAVCSGPTLGS